MAMLHMVKRPSMDKADPFAGELHGHVSCAIDADGPMMCKMRSFPPTHGFASPWKMKLHRLGDLKPQLAGGHGRSHVRRPNAGGEAPRAP